MRKPGRFRACPLKIEVELAMLVGVTGPNYSSTRIQRCDVDQGADGAVRVTIAGDWVRQGDVDLLCNALSDLLDVGAPMQVDLTCAGTLAPRARVLLERLIIVGRPAGLGHHRARRLSLAGTLTA